MKILLFIIAIVVLLAGCDSQMTDQSDTNAQVRNLASQQACKRGECPCDTPVGTILHGAKITTYTKGTPACSEGCGKYSEELTCNNGKFEKDITGLFFRCEVQECPSCTLGANLITSGTSVRAYRKAEVGCTESCDDFKIERTCNMGTLSGSDAYSSLTCKRKDCRCELPDQSSFLSLGGKKTLYSATNAVCGKTCAADYAQSRTCQVTSSSAGTEIFALSGSSSYRYSSCEDPSNCTCTLPNGTLLTHGMTKVLSKTATVACGQTCDAEPAVTVRCQNGTLVNHANPAQVVNLSSGTYAGYVHQCKPDQCVSCQVPGTSTSVLHGQSYQFAKKASIGCGAESCQYASRTCVNGTFTGDTTFNAATCTKRDCLCTVPGVSGITVPVGSTYSFFSAAAATCGQSCASISAARTCREVAGANDTYSYVFDPSTTHTFGSCAAPTGCSCSMPTGLNPIADGKTVTLTSQQTVACGTTCDQVPSINLKCSNGTMYRANTEEAVDVKASDFAFKYYCTTGACTDCQLPGYGGIPNNGNKVTLYSKNVLTCADDIDTLRNEFQCQNGALLRNGSRYTPPATPGTWYTSYTVNCPGCPFPDGVGFMSVGQSLTFFKWSGAVVNGCGQGCKSQVRTCQDTGSLDGDSAYTMSSCDNTCSMEGGGAPPRLCLLRWQNSFVSPDTQIPMWNRRTVGCGDSCQNHFKLARCKMDTGTFDAPLDYIYPACTEVCP